MPSNKTNQTPTKRPTRGTRAAAAAASATIAEEAGVEPESQVQAVKEEEAIEMKKEQEDTEMSEVNGSEGVKDGDENGGHSEVNSSQSDKNGDSPKKNPWSQKVRDGKVTKVPKEIQKRRRNFRLKKMIAPKAPVMILHEMLGSAVTYEVADPIMPQGPHMPQLFRARAVYQDTEFLGQGPSKSIAKNICAEQVLQYITTQSCSKQTDTMETEDEEKKGAGSFETDTPWSALASLAMFKLFNDWQAQGYSLPPELMRGSGLTPGPGCGQVIMFGDGPQPVTESKQKQKKEKLEGETQPAVRPDKELPPNFKDKHPVQLLNEMKGQLEWEEVGQEGNAPNCVFSLAVRVEDNLYTGQGRSKKDAKKAAAMSALSSLYEDYEC